MCFSKNDVIVYTKHKPSSTTRIDCKCINFRSKSFVSVVRQIFYQPVAPVNGRISNLYRIIILSLAFTCRLLVLDNSYDEKPAGREIVRPTHLSAVDNDNVFRTSRFDILSKVRTQSRFSCYVFSRSRLHPSIGSSIFSNVRND